MTFSASIFRIRDIMCLFPIKIVSRSSCSPSVKFWRQSIWQWGILDAHHAIWVWWKSTPMSSVPSPSPWAVIAITDVPKRSRLSSGGCWWSGGFSMGKKPGWSDKSGENEISRESMVLSLFSIYVYSWLFISLKVRRCLKSQNKINSKWCWKYDVLLRSATAVMICCAFVQIEKKCYWS